jgi:hypothetical protein
MIHQLNRMAGYHPRRFRAQAAIAEAYTHKTFL